MDFKSSKHKNNLMELFPLLLNDEFRKGAKEITPSVYVKELGCSTNERIENLVKTSKWVQGKTFKVVPNVVVFQNFKPSQVYLVTITLLNVTEVPKPLRIEMQTSVYFSIKHSSENIWTKVAPGMSYTLELKFVPDDFADYKHKILFLTEGDSINLDVIGIGPRPIMDIPDSIILPTTAINIQTEKTIIVRNLGQVPACFTLITHSPFAIKPERDIIKPNKCMKLTISCKPKVLGEIVSSITLVYDSGERLNICLKTLSEEALVSFSKNVLSFENTFMTLSEKLTVELKNLSDYNLSYCWKMQKYSEEDTKVRISLLDKFQSVKENELAKDNRIRYYEIANKATNQEVYNRILDDEEGEMESEEYLNFKSSNFIIEPPLGCIWRGTNMNFDILFRPEGVGEFEEKAYLHINGIRSRKVLTFRGICIGPKVILNVEEIDAQNIYIRAVHRYEVVFINTGPIPATISFINEPTKFGGNFRCRNSNFILKPKTEISKFLEFSSEKIGKFVEQVYFEIQESMEVLKVNIIGNIICPLLNFDLSEVNFGDVAIGVPITKVVNLVNTSQVAIEFTTVIPEDGLRKTWTILEFNTLQGKVALSSNPKEFSCEPYFGEVEPHSKMPIEVTLITNRIGAKEVNLYIFMWGSRTYNRSIPMKYVSHFPEIVCLTPKINLKSMFITHPYVRNLVLENNSDFAGLFNIYCKVPDNSPLKIESEVQETLMDAHEKVEIELIISCDVLGEFCGSIGLEVFGTDEEREICEIIVDVRGPCLDISIDKLNLGDVQTLRILEKQVRMENDSPIAANVNIQTIGDCILPFENSLTIPAEQINILTLQFYGKRIGKFKMTLIVNVENGDTETFNFTGNFFGGSILCEPLLDPVFNAGILLTERVYKFPVKVTNKGNVHHLILWSQLKNIKSLKNVVQPPGTFSIVPHQLELEPGHSTLINVTGFSKVPCNVSETFYLHAKTVNSIETVIYFSFIIEAEFEDPIVTKNKNVVQFRIDTSPVEIISHVEDTITLVNKTKIPVTISIDIVKPFYIIRDNELINNQTIELQSNEVFDLDLKFVPNILEKRCLTVENYLTMRYKNHPKVDKIKIIGTVNFPSLRITPDKIELDGVQLNQKVYQLIKIENISPIPLAYKFYWNEEEFYSPEGSSDIAPLTTFKCNSNIYSVNTLLSKISETRSSTDKKTEAPENTIDEIKVFEEFYTLRQFLYPLLASYNKNEEETFDENCKLQSEFLYDTLYTILDVVPSKGTLDPLECQIISIGINTQNFEQIKAKLMCEVIGGNTEVLPITVYSGIIKYCLESNLIDFNIVLANHISVKQFPLKNIGGIPFSYFLTTVTEWPDQFLAEPQWINVNPSRGILPSSEILNINVSYFPGRVGHFTEIIQLYIGLEECIFLKIKGYAAFPQIYFNLPRPGFNSDYVNLLSYVAIGDIVYPDHKRCDGYYPPSSIVTRLEPDDWVVVEYESSYPSVMDIEMAIERSIVNDHFLFHPHLIKQFQNAPTRPIPDLVLPYYEIDFGYVNADSVHDIYLNPIRYKPFSAKLKWKNLSKNATLSGLELQKRPNLDGIFLIFKPSSRKYKFVENTEHHIKILIYATIPGGATLNFQVTAVVTLPQLTFNTEVVDFGEIQCGYCLKKTILMETNGHVKCSWKANILNPLENHYPLSFFIVVTEGSFTEKTSYELEIYFKPTVHGKCENKLIFTIEMNPNPIPITLIGVGLAPELKISNCNINFQPTLPYTANNMEKLFITNKSKFPLELVFTDFNTDLDFEQHVIRFLKIYFKTKTLIAPVRKVDQYFSQELVDTYHKILNQLRECLKKKLRSKNELRYPAKSIEAILSEPNIYSDEYFQESNYNEIEKLLKDNLMMIRSHTGGFQNQVIFDENIDSSETPQLDSSKKREGLVFIFHGAPNTDFLQLANKTGRKLDLNVYNIDNVILNSVAEKMSLAAIKLDNEINQQIINLKCNSSDLLADESDDELEILERKINILLNPPKKVLKDKTKSSSKKKGDKTSRSTKSNKTKQSSNSTKSNKTKQSSNSTKSTKSKKSNKSSKSSKKTRHEKKPKLNLPENLLLEILQQKLLFLGQGFIIETLNSRFFPDPLGLYLSLLKILGNIRYIHMVYILFNFNDLILQKTKIQPEEEIIENEIRKTNEILEMSAEEYDALDQINKKWFYENVLLPRKQKFLKKEAKRREKFSTKKLKEISKKMSSKKSLGGVHFGSKTNSKASKNYKAKLKKSPKSSGKSSKASSRKQNVLSPEDLELSKEIKLSDELYWKLLFASENWNKKKMSLNKPLPAKVPVIKEKTKKNKRVKSGKSSSKGSSTKGDKNTKKSKASDKVSKKGHKKDKNSKKSKKSDKVSENEPAKQEQKVKVKILNSSEVLTLEENGVYCWIVHYTGTEVSLEDLVLQNILQSEELSKSINCLKNTRNLEFVSNDTLYSVLTSTPENVRSRSVSEIFTIYDALLTEELKKNLSQKDMDTFTSQTSLKKSSVSNLSNKELNRSSKTLSNRTKKISKSAERLGSKNLIKASSTTLNYTTTNVSSIEVEENMSVRLLKGRYIMEPNDKLAFDVFFIPKSCGDFSHDYNLSVISGMFNYTLNLKGKADIPKIFTEPEVLFSKVLMYQNPKKKEHCVYYKDQETFSFGPTFTKEDNKENNCFDIEGCINIINNSYLPCDISINFEEESSHFSVNENKILVGTNSSTFLFVYAHPTLSGTFKNKLLIAIKNNPKVECIEMACIGVAFDIEVVPQEVNFERVLLGNTNQQSISLKNNGLVRMLWKFHDPEAILDVFVPNIKGGFLNPMSSVIIKFKFLASKLEDIKKRKLYIEFYDPSLKCDDVLVKKEVEFLASVFEFFVDYIDEVRLGEVKISSEHIHLYNINNKSNIDLKYKFQNFIKKEESNEEKVLKSYFQIVPQEGVMKSHANSELKLIFTPLKTTMFNEMPIFKCTFIDLTNGNKYHSFDLKVSAKVVGSSFSICPPSEINFAHQLIQTEVTKEIIIKNKGPHFFSYIILGFKNVKNKKKKKDKKKRKGKGKKGSGKVSSKKTKSTSKKTKSTSKKTKTSKQSKGSKKSKGSNKSSSKKSLKAKLAKPTTLTQGIFTLTSSTGIVPVDSEAVIRVSCKPKKLGDFEEDIVVFISETAGKNKNGRKLHLRAKGCIPHIDFENYDDIFKEQFVVNNLNEIMCAAQVGLHPVFIKEMKQLYFNKSCINVPNVVRIKIRNSGEVGALVTCNILGHDEVFTISPKSALVDACKFVIFLITFTPTAINKFYGVLEFETFMTPNKYSIKLCGEGYLPEIQIIKPLKDVNGKHFLKFSPQLIGSLENKEVVLKNSGLISCKVLIGVQDDNQDSISLKPKEFPAVLQQLCSKEYLLQEFQHTLLMELNPEEECTVFVEFKAHTETINTCRIRIFIINNPYEITDIFVKTEGYQMDIILNGLETIGSDNDVQLESLASEEFFEVDRIKPFYKLDFGCQFLNKLHKRCFKITNVSEVNTYKFEFANFEKLIFIPSVGHLKPLASKDIIATFFTKEAAFHHEVLLELRICKITYLEPESQLLSWDERQQLTIWKSPEKMSENESFDSKRSDVGSNETLGTTRFKTKVARLEPKIAEIANSQKSLTIYFSITVDYCAYDIDVSEIFVDNTLMFEKKNVTFSIKNVSNVDLIINWSLNINNEYSKEFNEKMSIEVPLINYHKPQRPRTSCPPKRQTSKLSGTEHFYKIPIRPKSSLISNLSHISNLESTTSSLENDNIHKMIMPFNINPQEMIINPKESQIFTVTFSPYEACKYLIFAKANISNLSPYLKQPIIPIHATSILPMYHFNIDISDYLNRREGREVCGEFVDETTKILEFEVLGTGVPLSKKFTIMNPTGETFNYRWEKTKFSKNLSFFQCLRSSGTVVRGEMAEAVFTFIAEKKGTFEVVYTFVIEKYDLSTKFLLVGKARDPCTFFKQHKVVLKPTIVGVPISQEVSLVNNESEPLKFKILKSSTYTEDRLHKLNVEPYKGIINEENEFMLKLTFNPINVGDVTFSIECRVEKMEKPVILIVNAKCFNVKSELNYFDVQGSIKLKEEDSNIIYVPSMILMKKEELKFIVSNVGHVGFYFKWNTNDKFTEDYLNISCPEKEGYLKTGSSVPAVISLKTTRHLKKKTIDVELKILYGATYKITLICSTCQTKYKLSFKEYNFGACLVQKDKSLSHEAILDITNNDANPITIDLDHQQLDFLTIKNKITSILPKKIGKISFYFHPLEIQQYKAEITILINRQKQPVQIYGEGVPLEIELEDPRNTILNLGAIYVGKSVRQQVKVINKSKCSVSAFFGLYHQLPFFKTTTHMEEGEFEKPEIKPSDILVKKLKKKRKKSKHKKSKKGSKNKSSSKGSKKSSKSKNSKSSKKSSKSKNSKSSKKSSGRRDKRKKSGKRSTSDKKSKKHSKKGKKEPLIIESREEKQKRLIDLYLKILPQSFVKLLPKQTMEIIVTFNPKERMPWFTEQIYYQVQEYLNPICVLKGSCIAADYCLDYDRVNFGTVIKGYQNNNVVKLFNQGDIGGKYKWVLPKNTDFTISPMDGYITPGMSVVFETKYAPLHFNCLSRIKAQCIVEKLEKPLSLELIGTCINLPPPKEVIKFSCPVREKQTKKITIKNPSGIDWNIIASPVGNSFIVPEEISVESKSSTTFDVTYAPLYMTKPDKFHEEKLFLPLPEGQGFLYSLIGEAKRPVPIKKIDKTISCKVDHIEPMTITNWLPYPQQLTVLNQIDQSNTPKKVPHVIYKLQGNNFIDLLPYETKEYKWIIHALNEGKLSFKVKFRNEETTEYLEYDINLVVTKSKPLDCISMFACARDTCEYRLKLENPLKQATTFKISSPCIDLHFDKVIEVKPYTQTHLLLEYKPLLPVEKLETTLEAVTSNMGTFPYTLILKAGPSKPELPLYFETQLGSKIQNTAFLYNPLDVRVEFTSKIDSNDFSLHAPVLIDPKTKGKFDVTFEPNDIGGVQSKLILDSNLLGEFIYPLIGTCKHPTPQGPFEVDERNPITFKNPFLTAKAFSFQVDPAVFILKQSAVVIKAREKISIAVTTRITGNERFPLLGKLIIRCDDSGKSENLQWVMYLKKSVK